MAGLAFLTVPSVPQYSKPTAHLPVGSPFVLLRVCTLSHFAESVEESKMRMAFLVGEHNS